VTSRCRKIKIVKSPIFNPGELEPTGNPTTKEAKIGGSNFKAKRCKISTTPYLKNQLKAKEPGEWLKWQSPCLASSDPKCNPQYHNLKFRRFRMH
jgi:hypothetical protein